ncbi:ANTAR domain-containing protein [Rhodococcus rhodochrous J3]|jgi:GAF domain-containing protein|uniref:GAF and ANTAR domain-containing protein n=2 Tax=Rhodococcus rhodochrous TaxID=1829 RepID=A0AA46WXB2_RHORH|nr:GAF and ANTAR domain-containing protein [Rhodococcus rhodochrous]AYA25343.1 ANTAR domain-containing protein [Rhodococcus rhodochrous]MBF4478472.1 GAF and ANTAR domain-containing protein [Rhodococcus rhodochrous]MCB8913000.1 GAF and ANTAR domain-containing protein [Rhodococcus rhodochrous]MDJ0398832.1 GAF and ANTAR domain-containing protein [Rhodococcus rhodochrous]MDO1483497.1 GAF and ANTAR domain-containing protein [Rhodococcus rhodochrous]
MAESQGPTPDAWAAVFARMAGVLMTEQTVTTVLESITSLAKDTLPGSDGSGLTLVDEGSNRSTSAATGPLVERLDALQYELGEGPCLTAVRDSVTVRVDDLGNDPRWPDWSARAAEAGMSASLSIPLRYAGRTLGALKVYSTRPHVYTADSEDILGRFADQAAILLANMHTLSEAEALEERLLQALRDRDLIATAKGIVMLRENLDADRAVQRLLELSAQRRIAVREVAAEIVASTHTETV